MEQPVYLLERLENINTLQLYLSFPPHSNVVLQNKPPSVSIQSQQITVEDVGEEANNQQKPINIEIDDIEINFSDPQRISSQFFGNSLEMRFPYQTQSSNVESKRRRTSNMNRIPSPEDLLSINCRRCNMQLKKQQINQKLADQLKSLPSHVQMQSRIEPNHHKNHDHESHGHSQSAINVSHDSHSNKNTNNNNNQNNDNRNNNKDNTSEEDLSSNSDSINVPFKFHQVLSMPSSHWLELADLWICGCCSKNNQSLEYVIIHLLSYSY